MKLLVVTPEPIDATFLRETLGEDAKGAEVLVLSPATNQSKLAFWVSDPDDAIAEATTAETDTVERSGFREYYHPRTGAGHGEHRFGFATLALDLPAGFAATGAGVARTA